MNKMCTVYAKFHDQIDNNKIAVKLTIIINITFNHRGRGQI